MLVLFDIDATLITTGGVGVKAMIDAGRDLYGPGFTADGIPFAGRLDPLILADMLTLNGQAPTAQAMAVFRATYAQRLPERLAAGTGRALPGVLPLLAALEEADGVALGLLTGNFAETGSMKLAACGVDPGRFSIRVWGDESPHTPPSREHLPEVGMARYAERHGRRLAGRQVVIVGDTPHDVACARAHGCRSLAVATGQFPVPRLLEAGADHAVATLEDTPAIRDWIVG